jgi:hypothetical protein
MDALLEKQRILISDLRYEKVNKSPFKHEIENLFDDVLRPLLDEDEEGKVSVMDAERIWMTALTGRWIKDYVQNKSNLLSQNDQDKVTKWTILFSGSKNELIKLVAEKGPYVCMDAATLIKRKVKEDALLRDYKDIFSKSDNIQDWIERYKKRKASDYVGLEILNKVKTVVSLCDSYTGLSS